MNLLSFALEDCASCDAVARVGRKRIGRQPLNKLKVFEMLSAEDDVDEATRDILLSAQGAVANCGSAIDSVEATRVSVEDVKKKLGLVLCAGGHRCLMAVWRNESPTFKAME